MVPPHTTRRNQQHGADAPVRPRHFMGWHALLSGVRRLLNPSQCSSCDNAHVVYDPFQKQSDDADQDSPLEFLAFVPISNKLPNGMDHAVLAAVASEQVVVFLDSLHEFSFLLFVHTFGRQSSSRNLQRNPSRPIRWPEKKCGGRSIDIKTGFLWLCRGGAWVNRSREMLCRTAQWEAGVIAPRTRPWIGIVIEFRHGRRYASSFPPVNRFSLSLTSATAGTPSCITATLTGCPAGKAMCSPFSAAPAASLAASR